MDTRITFEEVATIRPDGAHNICKATVVPGNMILPSDYVYMKDFCGPFRHSNKKYSLGNTLFWQLDTEWSGRRMNVSKNDSDRADRVLSLRKSENHILSKDDYIWLAELGYVKTSGIHDNNFKAEWQVITLANNEIKSKLIAIGEKIKTKYKSEFDSIKAPYMEAVLNSVPAHLRRIEEYELQFLFHSDGWFLLHCIVALLNNGKLKPPTEEQKKSLTTLIVPNS